MSEPFVIAEHTNSISRLTLNRPKAFNALSEGMLDALQNELDTLPDQTRVVILAATGRAFCAGHDLKEMRQQTDQVYFEALFKRCSHLMSTLLTIRQPVIAEVQGLATAAGCQLVGTCDLAVASSTATFAVSGIDVGLFCSTPSVALSRNLSRKRAMKMLMTGEFIDAQTACDWGLINQAVEGDALTASTLELANQIIAKSEVAVTTGKALFYKQLECGIEEAYALAGHAMACNMMAYDVTEGIDAFIEKRSPEFKNR